MADSRGRPKRNAIDRFNVAVDLKDNRKFSLFMEYSGLSEGLAYLTVVGLWQLTATNYAFDGDVILEWNDEAGKYDIVERVNPRLSPDDGPALRRACYFQGPSETLISLLQKAGFLGPDMTVMGWLENQPLAEKLIVKRKLAQIGGQKSAAKRADKPADDKSVAKKPQLSMLPIKVDSLGLKVDSLAITEHLNPSQSLSPNPESLKENITPGVVALSESVGKPDASSPDKKDFPAAVSTHKQNGNHQFDDFTERIDFLDRLKELVILSDNDVKGILDDLKLCGVPKQVDVFEQISQAIQDKRWGVADGERGIQRPVAWIRQQIRLDAKERQASAV